MKSSNSSPLWLWVLRYGFCSSKLWGTLSSFLILFVSFLPAINVIIIRLLSDSLQASQSISLFLIVAGILFGAGGALQQIANTASRLNALKIVMHASDQFDLKLAKLSPKMYDSAEFMALVRKARQCISEGHPSSQFQASINIISASITAMSLAITLYDLSPKAALISFLAPIPTAIAYAWYGKQESKYWPLSADANRRAVYLQDQFSYPRTGSELSTMEATHTLASLAITSRNESRMIREKLEWKSMASDFLSGLVTTALFIVALVFLSRDTGFSTAAIFAGLIGLMSGVSAMASVGYQVGELAVSAPANGHFRALLETPTGDMHRIIPVDTQRFIVKDINVFYDHLHAVRDASFEVRLGDLCALVGENGSGKTSLIKALQGIQHDASGSVCINGTVLDVSDSSHWFSFAAVQQDYGRYELTVREFLTLGIDTSRIKDHAITDALRFAEAEQFVSALPNGLDSMLGVQWGGSELSGGQWQRLAIARAVLSDAPIWFLDEPTSAVDAPTEQLIFDRLATQSTKRIIILSSHRVSTLRAATNILVLKDGSICESGSYSTLMKEGTEFHRMFRSQIDNDEQSH